MSGGAGRAARDATWTVLSLLRTTAEWFESRGVEEPRLSAEHLLADALACRRLDLYLRYDQPLEAAEVEEYRNRVKRRAAGEPVQYILGRAAFRGLDLVVDPRVLVPRPETERLVAEVLEWAAAEARRGRTPDGGWKVLDLGTGSGAIALALAAELPAVGRVVASDVSPVAIELARENARRTGLAERCRFVAADGFTAFAAGTRFDAVVANPPYVARTAREWMPRQVVDWEPEGALFAGPSGEEAQERIVAAAPDALRPGGLLALEVGDDQASRVERMIADRDGLESLGRWRDWSDVERGVLALRV